ncbi:permease [Atrimonas thermophila]|uniref:permease n=1 Tax=Atrimonas thermophila TaxID=3064161 RepID=UPI00399CD26F
MKVDVSTLVLYGVALGWLLVSFKKDRARTILALKKAWKSFSGILPPFLTVIFLISLVIVFLPERSIAAFLGEQSGFPGYLIASLVGAITLIPGFVAFPMAKMLLDQGAGVAQMAVFISTLMMVGVVTAPLEARYFKFQATLWRNLLAYFYSFLVGYVVWIAVKGW